MRTKLLLAVLLLSGCSSAKCIPAGVAIDNRSDYTATVTVNGERIVLPPWTGFRWCERRTVERTADYWDYELTECRR